MAAAERTRLRRLARHGFYYRAVRGLRRGLDTWRLWQQRAHGRRQLTMFDDHLLRDIGVTYLEAEAEADKPFWCA